ncbi:MAG: hypothetical protein Q8L85_07190 [Alphaproteobacteria bacterium]|nr:hypothetical protein [Alphaproteobacteria bacterium]
MPTFNSILYHYKNYLQSYFSYLYANKSFLRDHIYIVPVKTIKEVLAHALTAKLVPIEWVEAEDPPKALPIADASKDDLERGLTTH